MILFHLIELMRTVHFYDPSVGILSLIYTIIAAAKLDLVRLFSSHDEKRQISRNPQSKIPHAVSGFRGEFSCPAWVLVRLMHDIDSLGSSLVSRATFTNDGGVILVETSVLINHDGPMKGVVILENIVI